MKITSTEKYTLLTPEQEPIKTFLIELEKEYSGLKSAHLIIDFSENINTTVQDLLLFLKISTNHRENGTSFVIICKGIDIDEIPDEINVVPTFEEAVDILEMDAIERDLGF
ncbi:ribonuclease Z [Lutibacter holmesii]|uniref:Ribonuclease Z n=1 Tax=Lutibacter holmesii TaxID=1137985 RepID=A0ABW3WP10_9FLAO